MNKSKATDKEGRQAYIVREKQSIHVAEKFRDEDGKTTVKDRKFTEGAVVYLSEEQFNGLKSAGRNAIREAAPSELKRASEQIAGQLRSQAQAELLAANSEMQSFKARKADALQRLTVEEENLKHRVERAEQRLDEVEETEPDPAETVKVEKGSEPNAESRPSVPAAARVAAPKK